MSRKPILWLVGTECPPEGDATFNEWYTNVHVPMLLKVPGIIGATRYEAVNPTFAQPKYLAVYEIEDEAAIKSIMESPELGEARADRKARSDVKFDVVRREYYKPIGDL